MVALEGWNRKVTDRRKGGSHDDEGLGGEGGGASHPSLTAEVERLWLREGGRREDTVGHSVDAVRGHCGPVPCCGLCLDNMDNVWTLCAMCGQCEDTVCTFTASECAHSVWTLCEHWESSVGLWTLTEWTLCRHCVDTRQSGCISDVRMSCNGGDGVGRCAKGCPVPVPCHYGAPEVCYASEVALSAPSRCFEGARIQYLDP